MNASMPASDIKSLSLKFFNKNVLIKFKGIQEGREQFIKGTLVGRVWGEKADTKNSKGDSTVIGITIKNECHFVDVLSSEIDTITELYENTAEGC